MATSVSISHVGMSVSEDGRRVFAETVAVSSSVLTGLSIR
jgi:hypothetical protein